MMIHNAWAAIAAALVGLVLGYCDTLRRVLDEPCDLCPRRECCHADRPLLRITM